MGVKKKNKSPNKGKKKKWTLKQLKWVKNYIKSGNKADATRKAGYKMGSKGGSGTKNRKAVNESTIGCQNYKKLRALIDEIWEKNKDIDVEWVLKRLIKEAEMDPQAKDRLKALELIGKHKVMFTDKVEHTGKETVIKVYIPDNKRGAVKIKKKAEKKA